jgi:hypothetical protein
MLSVEQFSAELAPLLKEQGFKKERLNWRKDLGPSTAVLNIQVSPWGDRSYYVNVGVYLKVLGAEVRPTHNRCHIQQRLPVEAPALVVSAALRWFVCRADIAALAELHKEGNLVGKGLVFKEVLRAVAA